MVNYKLFTTSCFLFCSVINAFAGPAAKYDICATPENKSGTCVVIAECPSLLKLLKKRPIPLEDEERLRQATCGFHGVHPKVCCALDASEEIISTTQQPVVPKKATTPEPALSDLLPSLNECGQFVEERILLGDETQLDGYPWMVLLEYEKPTGNGFHCGGVLINNRYVLTAAHCISGKGIDKDWKLVNVRLGEYQRDTDPDCDSFLFAQFDCCCTDPVIDVEIEEKIVHEQYDPNDKSQYNDIALLRLADDVEYTEFIRPICLQPVSRLANSSRPEDFGIIGGWGITELRSNSNKKQSARVQIRDNAQCESVYTKQGVHLREDQICAFAVNERNTCSQDSGGALMNDNHDSLTNLNYFALGVMSIGHPICGLNEYPVIYTKVQEYIPWIVSKLKS